MSLLHGCLLLIVAPVLMALAAESLITKAVGYADPDEPDEFPEAR